MTACETFDLVVIGGGINGAGVACDAAGRGLSVLLCEAGDLAGATSSASSKLVHGGLRYLEHYEFSLVREALAEREILLAKAPHIVWPLRFILPHTPQLRPRWMIRAGLFLYDHLARRQTIPGSQALRLDPARQSSPLRPDYTHAFSYWDCWVDDARLVVLNARAAADRGARILTRTRLEQAIPDGEQWRVHLVDSETGAERACRARAIVNAAGPWADKVLARATGNRPAEAGPSLRLVKGSHIVVPRLPGAVDAYILQNSDNRVVFVLPYEGEFSLIGTTDVAYEGDPADVSASADEIDYLLSAVARFMSHPLRREDIVHTFSGVRPLYDEAPGKTASTASRDYHIHAHDGGAAGPLLSVLGGKITTYRHLAEEVVDKLAPAFPRMAPAWTSRAALPGGELPRHELDAAMVGLAQSRPDLPPGLVAALARRHGALVETVLDGARTTADLGARIAPDLYEREVAYLKAREWARTPDDILWRRTKAGVHLARSQRADAAASLEAMLCRH